MDTSTSHLQDEVFTEGTPESQGVAADNATKEENLASGLTASEEMSVQTAENTVQKFEVLDENAPLIAENAVHMSEAESSVEQTASGEDEKITETEKSGKMAEGYETGSYVEVQQAMLVGNGAALVQDPMEGASVEQDDVCVMKELETEKESEKMETNLDQGCNVKDEGNLNVSDEMNLKLHEGKLEDGSVKSSVVTSEVMETVDEDCVIEEVTQSMNDVNADGLQGKASGRVLALTSTEVGVEPTDDEVVIRGSVAMEIDTQGEASEPSSGPNFHQAVGEFTPESDAFPEAEMKASNDQLSSGKDSPLEQSEVTLSETKTERETLSEQDSKESCKAVDENYIRHLEIGQGDDAYTL